MGFIGLSACCAREARGATTRDAVRLGTAGGLQHLPSHHTKHSKPSTHVMASPRLAAEGFRDKVDEAAVRVQQQLALKHRRKVHDVVALGQSVVQRARWLAR